MGIDYSDIINGIIIFLLIGLSAVSILANLSQYAENKYLKNKINYLTKKAGN